MSTEGHYVLEVMCDQKKPEACPEKWTFIHPTRMEALAVARDFGWLISKDRKAFCPDHAAERRASWR